MKKKINKLSNKERYDTCSKYYIRDAYDTCKDCPLQIDTIHCFNGVTEEIREVKTKLRDLEELLRKVKDKEIEVAE